MTLKDIFTTYWSQVTLILLAIGYLLKRLLDNRSRKMEINHSLYQQNRILTLKSYFSNYAKAELMWQQLSIYEILEHKMTAKEIDQRIFPNLNALQETTLELKLYLNDDYHKYFVQLTNGILSINGRLVNLYSSLNTEKSVIVKANDYDNFKETTILKNKIIMDEVCQKIKELYK